MPTRPRADRTYKGGTYKGKRVEEEDTCLLLLPLTLNLLNVLNCHNDHFAGLATF